MRFLVSILLSLLFLVASPVSADTGIVGTWAAPDLSMGGHAGGRMLANGTLVGSGEVVLENATERASFSGGTWQFTAGTTDHVDVCLSATPIVDPQNIFTHPFCFSDIPVGVPTRVVRPEATTLFIIHLF